MSPSENPPRRPCARWQSAPDSGTNTLIVTHKPNIRDAFGKDWFEIKEGEASIFKPEGGRSRPGRPGTDRAMGEAMK